MSHRSKLHHRLLSLKNINKNKRQNIYKSIQRQHLNSKTDIVVNLSDKQLTLIEKNVLNKGLNFCIAEPNKKKIINKMTAEIKHFIRNIQLKFMFKDNLNTKQPFTGNPHWQPPRKKCHPALLALTDALTEDLHDLINKNKIKLNISAMERRAILGLGADKDLIVKRADKGGCIVLLNASSYLSKMNSMLGDPLTYTLIPKVDLKYSKKLVDDIISQLNSLKFISDKQHRYLSDCQPKMPVMYGLPKIHKQDCPLRPIVSQIDSPSYKLNKYLDYLLTTAEKQIPFLLQDTTRYLQYIEDIPTFENNTPLLFTLDVVSLYTVLPHDMCVEYVTEMYMETLPQWNTYTPDIRPIPTSLLKAIINIILNQTFFEFNSCTYTQNFGITMGAPSSVKIANITLYKHLQKIQHSFTCFKPLYYYRLIDDIMGVWTGLVEDLLTWFNHLNNSHTTIKFTIEYSATEIPFLDTLTYLDNNKIKTRLYKKPSNKKQFLAYNSEHPKHVKNSIPYAQGLRYRRIIKEDIILNDELNILKNNFIGRGYPENLVNQKLSLAKNIDRKQTITYKSNCLQDIDFTPLVLTFSNIFNNNIKLNIYRIISRIWSELILMAPELNTIKKPKVIFKRCSSIGNSLESSHFPPKCLTTNLDVNIIPNKPPLPPLSSFIKKINYSFNCKQQGCLTCLYIHHGNTFKSTTYNKIFKIRENCCCESKNLIYLITCKLCQIQYVGETGNTLRYRVGHHRSNIKLKKHTYFYTF